MTNQIINSPVDVCNEIIYADFENQLDGDNESDKKSSFRKICEFFNSLTIYGTLEYPLFIESEVRKKLNLKKSIRRQNLKNTFVKIYAESSDGSIREQNALTEKGLYQVLASSNSALANDWWDIIYLVFKQLRQKGEVKLQKLIQTHKLEISKLTKSVEYAKKRHQEYQVEMENKLQNKHLLLCNEEGEKHQISGKLKLLEREIELNREVKNDDHCLVLDEIQKAYMFRIYVYIVNLKDHADKYNNYDLNMYDEAYVADINGDNLRYLFVSNDSPNFPACFDYKFITMLYIVESGTKLLWGKLHNSPYVKTLYHPKGRGYKYPVFETAMCFVEGVINEINRECISKLISEREEKQRQKREGKLARLSQIKTDPQSESIDILSKVLAGDN